MISKKVLLLSILYAPCVFCMDRSGHLVYREPESGYDADVDVPADRKKGKRRITSAHKDGDTRSKKVLIEKGAGYHPWAGDFVGLSLRYTGDGALEPDFAGLSLACKGYEKLED